VLGEWALSMVRVRRGANFAFAGICTLKRVLSLYTVFHKIGTPLYFSITFSNVDQFEWKLNHCIL